MWKRWIPLWLGLALVPPQAVAFTVSGTVIDPGSQPVAGVELFVYFEGNPVGGFPPTFTDSLGNYSLAGVPIGVWGFEYVPPSSSGLLTKLTSDVPVNGDTVLNVALDLGFMLSGTVTDTLGQPIFGIFSRANIFTARESKYGPRFSKVDICCPPASKYVLG